MVRGFYAAAAGVLTQQRAIDVVSNNISNAMTTGYKSQSTVEGSFGDHMLSRISSASNLAEKNIGTGSFMTVNIEEYTDFTQGSLEYTGRSVDMALQGEGFFLLDSEKYGNILTRNGQFEIDEDGCLLLEGVGKVLDKNMKEIKLSGSDFAVSADGTISKEGKELTSLYISAGNDKSLLTKVGEDTYHSVNGYEQAEKETFSIVQGSIEKANVNLATEMSKIIAGQNHFQSCTQILKIYDRINEICVNQIAKI